MKRLVALFILLPWLAWAQHVTGPLQTQNNLSEIATNGTQATARTNLGIGAAPGPFCQLIGCTLTGPLIAPSFNGLTITPTTGALTITNGKTLTLDNSIEFAGTDGTKMTFPGVSASIPGTNVVNAWSAQQFFNNGVVLGSSGLSSLSVPVNGASNANRVFSFQSAGVGRAQVGLSSNGGVGETPTSVFNPGSPLFLGAFGLTGGALGASGGPVTGGTDGNFLGFWMQGNRASGPLGSGAPNITSLAPWTQSSGQNTTPGGLVGNLQAITGGDQQHATLLSANPITTTASSPVLTIAMTNANVALSTTPQSWVCLSGATAVGGITPSGTCTPNGTGWLKVTSVSANSFTVNWTGNASSGATGGGSAVTVQPSFAVVTDKEYFNLTSGASGFSIGDNRIGDCNPLFYQLVTSNAGGQACQMEWTIIQSPTDGTKTMFFGTNERESDLVNRAADEGYQPDNYTALRPTTAWWTGPTLPLVNLASSNISAATWSGSQVTITTNASVAPLVVGQKFAIANMVPAGYNGNFTAVAGTTGNTVVYALVSNPGAATTLGSLNAAWNWGAVYSVFSGLSQGLGVYQGFVWNKNALVPASVDPTGHGGVGIDGFGAYSFLNNNPFATTISTSTITVTMQFPSDLTFEANGDLVYFPVSYTINGVTFGGPGVAYTMANVNLATGTFTITGTGTASGSGSGGGAAQTLMLDALKPYAPMQFWGEYAHGIIANPTSYFADGLIVHSRPGAGFGFDDGSGNIAKIDAGFISAGNMDLLIATLGTGTIKINGTAGLSCSGTPSSSFASVKGVVTHC